ncbi:MAG: hypothetical protein AAFX06_13875 [Planctomycetota bacterium]
MIIIATDEAGYGPKLGPLVVCASVWEISGDDPQASFGQLATPFVRGRKRIVVDDSKAVFRPASTRTANDDGYDKLEMVTLAGVRWSGLADDQVRIAEHLTPQDADSIAATPWLQKFACESVPLDGVQPLVEHWCEGDARLRSVEARVVTARVFNDWCDSGANKSDLLSHLTLDLVRRRIDALETSGRAISVYCDRHGGRRYYAPPLQAAFDDALVAVATESKSESHYRVPYGDQPFEIRFTVKGDSFAPVAFSSMVAKYLREKAMESFNNYFSSRYSGKSPLKPTAGYPVDADRFLEQIGSVVKADGIDVRELVRKR